LVVEAEVFELLAGAVIAAVGTTPLTVIASEFEPNAFEQATVIVFAPATSGTELVFGVVVAEPLIVQVVPPGIVVAPSTVYVTLIGVVVLLLLLAGDVIATTGGLPRTTVTVCVADAPNALVQTTGMLFVPSTSETELVVALVDDAPLTVQVVPAGIDAAPFTV
jgi:hypothetical protein